MNLLLLISGNKDMLSKFPALAPEDFEVIKIDEKHLSDFSFIRSLLRKQKYNEIYFGTLDIDFQRFTFFIFFFILVSSLKGGIIDEQGRLLRFNLFSFLQVRLPLFCIESVASLFVIAYFYIKFPLLRWMTMKKN